MLSYCAIYFYLSTNTCHWHIFLAILTRIFFRRGNYSLVKKTLHKYYISVHYKDYNGLHQFIIIEPRSRTVLWMILYIYYFPFVAKKYFSHLWTCKNMLHFLPSGYKDKDLKKEIFTHYYGSVVLLCNILWYNRT